jgi:zinc protease
LLARVLTDGDASRLHRSLVEEQKVAISADSHVESGFDPGLFWLFLTLPAGGDLDRAEQALDAQIERITAQGITADELSRARNQALADFWRGMATIDGKAEALGSYAVIKGGYRKLFDAPREYEKVTAEDIRKLASDLLRKNNRTVGVLVPVAKEAE